jgi:L-lactate dehydrogenase (cytochrome)
MGSAEGEITLRENCRAFEANPLSLAAGGGHGNLQSAHDGIGSRDFVPSDIGSRRLLPTDTPRRRNCGRTAGEAGTGYMLSTISGHKLENVKAGTKGFTWYQPYLAGGRVAAEGAIERARKASYSALVVTIDTAIVGLRERDPRNAVPQLMGENLWRLSHSSRSYSCV